MAIAARDPLYQTCYKAQLYTVVHLTKSSLIENVEGCRWFNRRRHTQERLSHWPAHHTSLFEIHLARSGMKAVLLLSVAARDESANHHR